MTLDDFLMHYVGTPNTLFDSYFFDNCPNFKQNSVPGCFKHTRYSKKTGIADLYGLSGIENYISISIIKFIENGIPYLSITKIGFNKPTAYIKFKITDESTLEIEPVENHETLKKEPLKPLISLPETEMTCYNKMVQANSALQLEKKEIHNKWQKPILKLETPS